MDEQAPASTARSFGRLLTALIPLALLLSLVVFWPAIAARIDSTLSDAAIGGIATTIDVLCWMAAAHFVLRLIDLFVWRAWFTHHIHRPAPKLLSDLTTVVVWFAALIAILAFVFDVSVSGFLTGSGIVIAVIGFALRNLIADVFTGIALGIERPLHIGDWIELADGAGGEVVEINWRATRLLTREDIVIVVPNSHLATVPFRNYHAPHAYWRDAFQIILPHEVTAYQAERVLLSAVSQVPESANLPRKPEVRVAEYNENGIRWELRFWVPDYQSMPRLRYEVQRNVMRNLHFSGIHIPRERVEFINATDPQAHPDRLHRDIDFLKSTELFRELDEAELTELLAGMAPRICLTGKPIIRQGEQSASLFMVKEGYLDVFVHGRQDEEVRVGQLVAGMFFGEMSLLTGEPCGATVTPSVDTVVLEVKKEDLEPFLRRRPELVTSLGEALANRQMRNDSTLQERSEAEAERERQRLAHGFRDRIASFFGLGRRPMARVGE